MTKLSCSVAECSNNSHNMCILNSINVSGGKTKDNTCCSNFTTSPSYTSSLCNAKPETNIGCEAHDCKHNENCSCHASSIKVCKCGVACNCHDTECGTFEKN